MGDNTGIEWTDATWNPTTGCTKVSQGCKHCYAERDWPRLVHLPAYQGREFTDVACHPERLDQPLRWKKPRRIFVNSMSDLFHEDIPDEFIEQVFAVMALCPQHIFQVLTKRPERMRKHPIFTHSGNCLWVGVRQCAEKLFGKDPGALNKALLNVHIGVSVEDQFTADERIPLLLQTPAVVRWISAEPLLGPIDLRLGRLAEWNRLLAVHNGNTDGTHIHWVVAGGESGPKARPSHPDWFRSLRDQCKAAGVPFLFKQWDEYRRRGAGPWVRRMLQTKGATDAGGTMHYYIPRSPDDPLYGRLAYVCWMAYRPIEDIQDIASYRNTNVRAAFSLEDDAIEFCKAHNE